MCMQDLIISRAVTWRVANAYQSATPSGTPVVVLPPSTNRLQAYCYDQSGPSNAAVMKDISGANPVPLPTADGQAGQTVFVSAQLYPGIFSGELYAIGLLADLTWYEAVMDPPLADAVQRGYGKLLTGE